MKNSKSKVQELVDRIMTDYQNLSNTKRGDFLRALSDDKFCRYCGNILDKNKICWLRFESGCDI